MWYRNILLHGVGLYHSSVCRLAFTIGFVVQHQGKNRREYSRYRGVGRWSPAELRRICASVSVSFPSRMPRKSQSTIVPLLYPGFLLGTYIGREGVKTLTTFREDYALLVMRRQLYLFRLYGWVAYSSSRLSGLIHHLAISEKSRE